ncbi:MAG: hypothetical protein JWO05_1020 [Gemmatimonadetes bacterium]|nr:hypothetical protein [Gemmatimonadota bacterium]
MTPIPRLRAAAIGAAVLALLPLYALPLLKAGKPGFLAYLSISDAYYRGARAVMGERLFPAHEFGVIPNGVGGVLAATVMYGLLGAALGVGISVAVKRR